MDRFATFLKSLLFFTLLGFAAQSYAEYYLVYPGPYVVCQECCRDCQPRQHYSHKSTHKKKSHHKNYHYAKYKSACYVEESASCPSYESWSCGWVKSCEVYSRYYYPCPAHRYPTQNDERESYEWVQ